MKERPLRELHLFAGGGGGILGGMLLGHRTVCAVELEPYRRKILLQRQRDGILPWFPIWDDVTTFDGKPWRGIADVVAGGFPCRNISTAGDGEGLDGEESKLYFELSRVVREVGPRYVWLENSATLTSRGLGRILRDLAEMGYDARWCVLGSADVGLPHLRERIWILADNLRFRDSGCFEGRSFGEARQRGASRAAAVLSSNPKRPGDCWPQPLLRGMDARLASALDRVATVGDSQCPSVVSLAWRTLSGGIIPTV